MASKRPRMHGVAGQKLVEDQLAWNASVLANVEDAVVGADPGFCLTIWNRGAERLYGFSAEEVLGRDAREVVAVAVRSDDGELTGYLGIHRDISERKRAEEALRGANQRIVDIADA